MAKLPQVLPYPHSMSLSEAFQANDMKFAFVNPTDKNFQMVHPWVKCREYFNELLMKNHHPDEYEFIKTFGFDYRYDEFPLDMSETRIAIKFKDKEQKNTFIKNLPWIHAIESINNVDKTLVQESVGNVVVVLASKMWIQKCLLTNIYTLLLKLTTLGIQDTPWKTIKVQDRQPSEINYIQTLTAPVMNNLLENCTTLAEIPTKYVDGSDNIRSPNPIHGQSGIIYVHHVMKKPADWPNMKTLLEGLTSLFTGKFKNEFIKV